MNVVQILATTNEDLLTHLTGLDTDLIDEEYGELIEGYEQLQHQLDNEELHQSEIDYNTDLMEAIDAKVAIYDNFFKTFSAEGIAYGEFTNTSDVAVVLPVYIIHDNAYESEADASVYNDGKDVPRLRYAIVEPNETIEYGIQCDFYLYSTQIEAEEQIAEDASL